VLKYRRNVETGQAWYSLLEAEIDA